MTPSQHQCLVQKLSDGVLPGTENGQGGLIETHISSVIVCPEVVYKIKRPLDLGFLDFSTLDKRRHFCHEELRLNQRLSPQLYIDVFPIYGTLDAPSLNVSDPVLEYAVRMKPFKQNHQLDRMLDSGLLTANMLARLGVFLAGFHQMAQAAVESTDYGSSQRVRQPVEQSFCQIRSLVDDVEIVAQLDSLEKWSQNEWSRLRPNFKQRRQAGFVRECHGDLHLRNLAWQDDAPLAFDCIEFAPDLYWIDVMSDLAFLWMDLCYRRRPDLAWMLLNRYLEHSGDYAGLKLLQFYAVYRAMVRAKVAAISLRQADEESRRALFAQELQGYLQLAQGIAVRKPPLVCLMHGSSGSGKSHLANQLSAPLNAVVLRSDAVRKQLFASALDDHEGESINQGIYSAEATRQTYLRLQQLAGDILNAGYSVILDATFSQPGYREQFRQFASELGLPWVVIDIHAPMELLRERVLQRQHDISDADVRVLEHQLEHWRPLASDEADHAVRVDAGQPLEASDVARRILALADAKPAATAS